ncbi:GSU2403 family nucleotidyltransferase fold protein [Variovorax robiniae]|uniref:GSU2403 family nucleotidyltransferase fold protein n=1 Tax=Variovorax robiniae TaxID=1836199 RepID=A0ABU8X9X5_9BURK
MNYIPLSDNAARQAIDSSTIFGEFSRVQAQARQYVGGMYWKQQGEYEYLVKTQLDNRQQRIGPRSPDTEKIYADFSSRKQAIEGRLSSLKDALKEAERLNKALKVGRVPAIVISILQALEAAELGEHFTVVGTHALYAYESAAGVRIAQGALATQDVDLLWDARRRVRFIADMARLETSVLCVLQRADPTFQRKEDQNETAISASGFEVDFLRRQPEGDDPHPFRFSDDEGDLWPVQAIRASTLTSAPRFEHIVISVTGRMAMMRTIAPEAFVEFKRWMADKAKQRPEVKRRRDRRQADIVQAMLDEGLLPLPR